MPDSSRSSPSADIDDPELARWLATGLLDIGAVSLRPQHPFTWSSGLVSPIYCDNRLTLGHPRIRRAIAAGFADLIRRREMTPITIAGTATAGIPHAAWVAERLEAPMVYVRSEAKGHGQGQRIEGGELGPDTQVIVVEDLISTGASALDAVSALRDTGAHIRAVLAIFSYNLDQADAAFWDAEVNCHVLTDVQILSAVARRDHGLSEEAAATLEAWRTDPEAWSREHEGTKEG